HSGTRHSARSSGCRRSSSAGRGGGSGIGGKYAGALRGGGRGDGGGGAGGAVGSITAIASTVPHTGHDAARGVSCSSRVNATPQFEHSSSYFGGAVTLTRLPLDPGRVSSDENRPRS